MEQTRLYMTTAELADDLRCSEQRVLDYINSGAIPSPTITGHPHRWLRAALVEHGLSKLRTDDASVPGVPSVSVSRPGNAGRRQKSV